MRGSSGSTSSTSWGEWSGELSSHYPDHVLAFSVMSMLYCPRVDAASRQRYGASMHNLVIPESCQTVCSYHSYRYLTVKSDSMQLSPYL